VSEKDPTVKVELTSDRNVRVSLTFYLKFKPLPGGLSPAFENDVSGSSGGGVGVSGLPFRLGVMSEYILDAETGRIVRHQLKETRINGQLTPADVVSRWVQRLVGGGEKIQSDDGAAAADSLLQGLMDTVNWMRSLSDSNA